MNTTPEAMANLRASIKAELEAKLYAEEHAAMMKALRAEVKAELTTPEAVEARRAKVQAAIIQHSTSRINPDMLKELRPAIEPRGPLYGGAEVKTSVLNAFSRAWRRLVADLKCDETSERFKYATELLIALNVRYRDGENNSRTFFLLQF